MEYYNSNTTTAKDSNQETVSGFIIDEFTVNLSPEETYKGNNSADKELATIEDVIKIVQEALSSLKIYVLESDITEAQNSVRAIVKQAMF